MLRHLLRATSALVLLGAGGIIASSPSDAASAAITAGRRYVDRIFTDVDVTKDVIYATAPSLDDASAEALLMDVYTPAGDSLPSCSAWQTLSLSRR